MKEMKIYNLWINLQSISLKMKICNLRSKLKYLKSSKKTVFYRSVRVFLFFYIIFKLNFWLRVGRSRSGQIMSKFEINIFRKKYLYLANNFLRIPKCHSFSSMMRRTPKNRKPKMRTVFRYILQIPFSYRALVSIVVIAFWSRVNTK